MSKNYLKEFDEAQSKKNNQQIEQILREACDDKGLDESSLAQVMVKILNYDLKQFYPIFGLFSARYPESLHPFQVFYAQYVSAVHSREHASEEARYYLKKLLVSKVLLQPQFDLLRRHGILMAFNISTDAYLTLGARSYCRRIYEYAKKLPGLQEGHGEINRILALLENELTNVENKARDQMWEDFFSTGKNFDRIITLCQDLKWDFLAKRFDLINSERAIGQVDPFEIEFFKIIYTDNIKNIAVLQ